MEVQPEEEEEQGERERGEPARPLYPTLPRCGAAGGATSAGQQAADRYGGRLATPARLVRHYAFATLRSLT